MTRRYVILFGIVVVIGMAAGLVYRQFIATRVVVRATTTDGVELCVAQGLGEPFTTGFYYRKPGGPWGWFYYDHEDSYWQRGRLELDHQSRRATVWRGGKPVIVFDWDTETYTLIPMNRTLRGAQAWKPTGWRPPWQSKL